MEWSFPPKATWSFLGTPTLQDWVTPISRVIPPAPGLLVTQTNVMPIKCNWKIETLQNCTLKTVNSNKLYLNKGYVQYSGFEHLSVVYFDLLLGAACTKKCPKYFFEPFSTKTAEKSISTHPNVAQNTQHLSTNQIFLFKTLILLALLKML